jgi:predicted transcriptional regulator
MDQGTRAKTTVTLTTDRVSGFFTRSRERARKLDRGERILAEITVTFEDPSDLMQVLSAERVRVLHAVRTGAIPVSQLANDLKRNRQAVSRDVKLLESFGLLKTRHEPNPGHGRRKIVAPLAGRYQLVANI